ncbi:MAG: CAP domain-containing protein [Fibrobacterota bacterium]|nr:CAP domain-containing protein [Chitinispirillaceae bacterium]
MQKHNVITIITIAGLIALGSIIELDAGYGDLQSGLPTRQERESLTFTNAVRLAPQAFRDTYIPTASTILQPANYPAVGPVWYNHNLNTASHVHSVDMAENCGMKHESCDNTPWSTRVKSYYTSSTSLAENVATGNPTGIATVIQWLRDDDVNGLPAADKSKNDGHRINIMNGAYKEMGNGYAYSESRKWYHFWTQDFGGATGNGYKIPAGTHFTPPNSSTKLDFAAIYYDKTGQVPSKAIVVIDETENSMTLSLGTASAGMYLYSRPKDNNSHCYYFKFTDGTGAVIRYPETMILSTASDAGCSGAGVRYRSNTSPVNTKLYSSGSVPVYTIRGESVTTNTVAAGITIQYQNGSIRAVPAINH